MLRCTCFMQKECDPTRSSAPFAGSHEQPLRKDVAGSHQTSAVPQVATLAELRALVGELTAEERALIASLDLTMDPTPAELAELEPDFVQLLRREAEMAVEPAPPRPVPRRFVPRPATERVDISQLTPPDESTTAEFTAARLRREAQLLKRGRP